MYRVKKRDGSTAAFNIKKVASAIRKAFDACDREYTDSVIDLIALRITSDFEPKIQNNLIDVEKIQDSAEKVLSESGYADVSKAYILYRKPVSYTHLDVYKRQALALVIAHATARNGIPNTPSNPNNT